MRYACNNILLLLTYKYYEKMANAEEYEGEEVSEAIFEATEAGSDAY